MKRNFKFVIVFLILCFCLNNAFAETYKHNLKSIKKFSQKRLEMIRKIRERQLLEKGILDEGDKKTPEQILKEYDAKDAIEREKEISSEIPMDKTKNDFIAATISEADKENIINAQKELKEAQNAIMETKKELQKALAESGDIEGAFQDTKKASREIQKNLKKALEEYQNKQTALKEAAEQSEATEEELKKIKKTTNQMRRKLEKMKNESQSAKKELIEIRQNTQQIKMKLEKAKNEFYKKKLAEEKITENAFQRIKTEERLEKTVDNLNVSEDVVIVDKKQLRRERDKKIKDFSETIRNEKKQELKKTAQREKEKMEVDISEYHQMLENQRDIEFEMLMADQETKDFNKFFEKAENLIKKGEYSKANKLYYKVAELTDDEYILEYIDWAKSEIIKLIRALK